MCSFLNIAFFGTKPYDKIWFDPLAKKYGTDITFYEDRLSADTVKLAKGHDAVCNFVNDDLSRAGAETEVIAFGDNDG